MIFVDARDLEDSEDLPSRGESKFNEHKRILSFQSEILINGPFKYEKDWNLGDIVTVKNKDWGVSIDTRITELTEIYEQAGFRLDVVFGESLPTLTEKLKSSLGELKIDSMK